MANINAAIGNVFKNGGRITIRYGAKSLVVLNVKDGTLSEKVGGYERIKYPNNGTNPIPLEGNPLESEISLEAFYTSLLGPDEIIDILHLRNTTTQEVQTFSLDIERPIKKGSNNYAKRTYNNCYIPDGYEIKAAAGTECDTIAFKFMSCDPLPALTAWS